MLAFPAGCLWHFFAVPAEQAASHGGCAASGRHNNSSHPIRKKGHPFRGDPFCVLKPGEGPPLIMGVTVGHRLCNAAVISIKKSRSTNALRDLDLKPGDDLLSHGETPHYHRRCTVSLLSSRWNQVVPVLYDRQANCLVVVGLTSCNGLVSTNRAVN